MNMAAPSSPTLFPLRQTGDGPTLVFLPDLGGNVLYARKLVAALPPRINCLAMRLPAHVAASDAPVTIEELASDYAHDLAARGTPVHLAGFSFAGFLAFESARALADTEGLVARVWLLDTRAHRLNWVHALRDAPAQEARAIVRSFKQNWHRRVRPKKDNLILSSSRLLPMDLSTRPAAYRPTLRKLYHALAAYRPAPWPDAPVTLFRASDDAATCNRRPDLGWRRLAGDTMDIQDLPGDHLSILEHPGSLALAAAEIARSMTPPPTGPLSSGSTRPRQDPKQVRDTERKAPVR